MPAVPPAGERESCRGWASETAAVKRAERDRRPRDQRDSPLSSLAFTSGHSAAVTLKYAESRTDPSGMIMWFRKTPSNRAPIPA